MVLEGSGRDLLSPPRVKKMNSKEQTEAVTEATLQQQERKSILLP